MKKDFFVPIFFIAAAAAVRPLGATARWHLEVYGGTDHNFPIRLMVRQSGFADIVLTARYDPIPFEIPPYYDVRLGRWQGDRGWEVELVHQKLRLVNKPAAIQHFEISHGYNLIDINRAWRLKAFTVRVGAGCIMTHPESTVRGTTWNQKQGFLGLGWFISGPTGQVAVGRDLFSWRSLFLTAEGKFTGSLAWVPIVDGFAFVPNLALHGLVGVRYRF